MDSQSNMRRRYAIIAFLSQDWIFLYAVIILAWEAKRQDSKWLKKKLYLSHFHDYLTDLFCSLLYNFII